MTTSTNNKLQCSHCGEDCIGNQINVGDNIFCCEGCKMVYGILNEHGLCDYYALNQQPGITRRTRVREDKFFFLDDAAIVQQLISFRSHDQTQVVFYLPQIHCSSCLYLLENLYKIDSGVFFTRVNFPRKEATIAFDENKISLRKVAELLTSIGYEPYISLNNLQQKKPSTPKTMIYQLGIAGFCFANIMMMSFPEYLGLDKSELSLQHTFRYISFLLSLPVLFYSAQPFYNSAYKSIKHKFLNIDAPIVLAILVTFIRSAYEVLSNTGSGYFDSMTGIVFFMLIGRVLQNRTYEQLSFERDYTSYFPIAVTVLKNEKEIATRLPDIKNGDTLLIHNEELIPADGILTRGKAYIDYSFVTGESVPVLKEMGEIVYAGGKQTGGNIEILALKEVAQSYLTHLWNNAGNTETKEDEKSFVHLISRYFTYMVFAIAIGSALYWWWHNPAHIWPAVTAVLIIACPCALLLSNSFTNGNILRILSRNGFYLRNAAAIETIADTSHIVFDKTGTLTTTSDNKITYTGKKLSGKQLQCIAALASQSNHPLSKAVATYLGKSPYPVLGFKEVPAKGIEGLIEEDLYMLGSIAMIPGEKVPTEEGTKVYVAIENNLMGYFSIENRYRNALMGMMKVLKNQNHQLSILTGDNSFERKNLQEISANNAKILCNQLPDDKLRYIKQMQQNGQNVMMIGDGLNDAGALKQSNTGVAITEDSNNFTPASNAILDATKLTLLPRFIQLCKANRSIVIASFVMSITYNIIGLFFAVQGSLSPLIAAILMPSSSLSIILLTYGTSNIIAKWWKL